MKYRTKRAFKAFVSFLVMIGIYGALIAICNHWLSLNGWSTKVLLPLLIMSGIYVNYKLWLRLCRRLDNNNKS
jgi:hypothetical protein